LKFEVVPQQNCGREIVNRMALTAFVVSHSRPHLARFPAGKTLVNEFNFEAKFFAKARGEPGRFVSHFSRFACNVQRVSDNDSRNLVAAARFTQTPQVSLAIRALQSAERLRREAEFVRESEAHSFAAVVNRKNSCARTSLGRAGQMGVVCVRASSDHIHPL
jgi:hypothetical protein